MHTCPPRSRIASTRTRLARHVLGATPLILALWTCFVPVAHARRGIPLFVIISDNPLLLLIGVGLVAAWAYSRFGGSDD